MKTILTLIFLSAAIGAVAISGCIGGETQITGDEEKVKSEIQSVLDRQCDAIKSKNIDALMATFDREYSKNYAQMKSGWEGAFSDVNVTGCKMTASGLKINKDTAEVKVEGTMTSVLSATGKTKTDNFTEQDNFRKAGSEWKQVY